MYLRSVIALFALIALLALAAPAQAERRVLRLAADSTTTWETRPLAADARVRVDALVRGRLIAFAYTTRCGRWSTTGFAGRGVLVEFRGRCHRRAPMRIRVANLRDRPVRVTARFWVR